MKLFVGPASRVVKLALWQAGNGKIYKRIIAKVDKPVRLDMLEQIEDRVDTFCFPIEDAIQQSLRDRINITQR